MTGGGMVSGQVIGAERVVQHLGVVAPQGAVERLRLTIRALGYALQRKVQFEKLAGQVLKKRSGRLVRSVNTKFIDTPDTSTARTGSALWYGRMWELFGSKAHIIEAKAGSALSWPGAEHPVRRVFHPAQAARPWLRPALFEMRPMIHEQLSLAMRGL